MFFPIGVCNPSLTFSKLSFVEEADELGGVGMGGKKLFRGEFEFG
jgi:hypothetical protein